MKRFLALCLIALIGVLPLAAQTNDRITDDRSEAIYAISAVEGQVLDARIVRISGDLIPLLVLRDGEGSIIVRSDLENTTGQAALNYTVTEDGNYELIASRLDEVSTGDFILQVGVSDNKRMTTSIPVLPEWLSTAVLLQAPLRSMEGNLNDDVFEAYYALYLNVDDQLEIEMERISGDLEPLLALLDAEQNLVVRGNTDEDGLAVFETTIEEAGWYFIAAARFDTSEGDTQGRYRLTFTHS